jgi:hypothetical protein
VMSQTVKTHTQLQALPIICNFLDQSHKLISLHVVLIIDLWVHIDLI